jgi:hypothetical protein
MQFGKLIETFEKVFQSLTLLVSYLQAAHEENIFLHIK